MNAPAVLELPLDDNLLKVLSSESRREILRLLAERRMTGAELAARLNLGKPAVSEHLKKLQDSELIERFDDPERRWVYYGLSHRGRSILEPQKVRFYLVLAVAALGLMLGMALALGIVAFLQSNEAGALGAASLTGTQGAGGQDALMGNLPAAQQGTLPQPKPAASGPLVMVAPDNVVTEPFDPNPGPAAAAPVTIDDQTFRLILPNSQPVSASDLQKHNVYVQRLDLVNHTITVNVVQGADLDALATLSNQTIQALVNSTMATGGLIGTPPMLIFTVQATPINATALAANATAIASSAPIANSTAATPSPTNTTASMTATATIAPTVVAVEPAPNATTAALPDTNGTASAVPPVPTPTTNSTLVDTNVTAPQVSATNTTADVSGTNNTAILNQAATIVPQDVAVQTTTPTAAQAETTTVAPAAVLTSTSAIPNSGLAASDALVKPGAGGAAVQSGSAPGTVHQVPRDNSFAALAALLAVATVAGLLRGRRA